MRARFAARFGVEENPEDGTEPTRSDAIRSAFNSPFWPFVLASTSVGQEGLDFHLYCHAVVHWNLPSNPVDLEQREGRVHRYKGHAVRKNLATVHGGEALLRETERPLVIDVRIGESRACRDRYRPGSVLDLCDRRWRQNRAARAHASPKSRQPVA